MAPTKRDSSQAKDQLVFCPKPGGCIGHIRLGVLVHKKSTSEKPMCRVCLAAGKQRPYVVPPGASLNPADYRKPGSVVVSGSNPVSGNGRTKSGKGNDKNGNPKADQKVLVSMCM